MSSEINDCVRRSLNRYFRDLDGQAPHAAIWAVETAEEPDIVRIATGGRLG